MAGCPRSRLLRDAPSGLPAASSGWSATRRSGSASARSTPPRESASRARSERSPAGSARSAAAPGWARHSLHGDVAAAFAYNPVVFVSLVLGVIVGVLWIIEALGGPRIRPPATWRAAARLVRPAIWWTTVVVLAALYVVLRHLA